MKAMKRTSYLTDLSDAEWDGIASLFPAPATHGRPRLHSPREIFTAIVSLLRSGCAWRLLPHDLPPWKTVYHSFRLWQKNGLWERIHRTLRERVRVQMGRQLNRGQVSLIAKVSRRLAYLAREVMMQARRSRDANGMYW